jgi:hypothetical protein
MSELPAGGVFKEWALKLVPVILVWGITSEVRVQTLMSDVTRIESRAESIEHTKQLVTKNTVLLEAQIKKMDSLEREIHELLRFLTQNPRRRNRRRNP